MVKLVATKPMYLSGKGNIAPGMSFDVPPKDARILKAIGRAKDFEPVMELGRPTYQTRHIVAETAAAVTHHDRVLAGLRARLSAFNVEVDRNWDEKQLRDELEKAREARRAKAEE